MSGVNDFAKSYYDARLKYTDQIGFNIQQIQICFMKRDLEGAYVSLMSYEALTFPFIFEPSENKRNEASVKDLVHQKKDIKSHYERYLETKGSDVRVSYNLFNSLVEFYKYLMICTKHLLLPLGGVNHFDPDADEEQTNKVLTGMLEDMGL